MISTDFLCNDLVHHPIETTINIWLFRLPGKHSWIKWQWKFRNAVWDETIKALYKVVTSEATGVSTSRTFQTTAMEVVFFRLFFWVPWFPVNNKPDTNEKQQTQTTWQKKHTQLIRYHVTRFPSHNKRKYENLDHTAFRGAEWMIFESVAILRFSSELGPTDVESWLPVGRVVPHPILWLLKNDALRKKKLFWFGSFLSTLFFGGESRYQKFP